MSVFICFFYTLKRILELERSIIAGELQKIKHPERGLTMIRKAKTATKRIACMDGSSFHDTITETKGKKQQRIRYGIVAKKNCHTW